LAVKKVMTLMLRYKSLPLIAATLAATALPLLAGRQERIDLTTLETPIYTVDGDAFVGHNGGKYCNRPLYCNHLVAVAFGGDKPYTMVGSMKTILGNLMFALVRDGKGKWLQNASDITSKYRPGRMEWIVKDDSWGATIIHLEVVPTAEGPGVVTHVRLENAMPGDSVVWASGAAIAGRQSVLWEYDMTSQKVAYMDRGFAPDYCAQNVVQAQGDAWTVQTGSSGPIATGHCSEATTVAVADAGAWEDPVALLASHGASQPIACGSVSVASNQDVYWCLRGPLEAGVTEQSPTDEFSAGMQRVQTIEKQVVVDTPDPWLNAAVGASTSVIDGVFRGGIYTHAGMRWGNPLLGWRTLFGGTVYGAHDNVKADATTCIAKQLATSDKTAAHADPATLLASQAPDSLIFGKGRIADNKLQPYHYDMQSQFFDQVQHAWRWTGDPDLEKLLRPSLDLDCEYIKDCFDPEGLGIYESYATPGPPMINGTTAAALPKRPPTPTAPKRPRLNSPSARATRPASSFIPPPWRASAKASLICSGSGAWLSRRLSRSDRTEAPPRKPLALRHLSVRLTPVCSTPNKPLRRFNTANGDSSA
jgi:hypothetical protein